MKIKKKAVFRKRYSSTRLPLVDQPVHLRPIRSTILPSPPPPQYLPSSSPSSLIPCNDIQFNTNLDSGRLRNPITRLPTIVCKEYGIFLSTPSGHFD